MKRKRLRIGIATPQEFRARTHAIVRGEYKPKVNEPKVWFESLKSAAQVLSEQNQVLLKVIDERHPESLKELEEMTGRKSSSLSRTLKTMEKYGIVKLRRENNHLVPEVIVTSFQIEFGIRDSFA
ncbi:MAG: hypothetical protein P1P74_07395 [Desulfuromonadales bacterium]|nr:hypothetical protein [Desulfuromonadales bacterium]MDT8423446.1 hypothetical protein [Desulfuromonadales bacterium]